jgi:hypothetical protein
LGDEYIDSLTDPPLVCVLLLEKCLLGPWSCRALDSGVDVCASSTACSEGSFVRKLDAVTLAAATLPFLMLCSVMVPVLSTMMSESPKTEFGSRMPN